MTTGDGPKTRSASFPPGGPMPGEDLIRAVGATLPGLARAVVPGLGAPTWRPGRDQRAVRIPAPTPGAGPDRRPGRLDRHLGVAGGGDPHVVVVGGGIAGIAAAVGLAERGVRVTLLEAGDRLGGRVASWPIDGEPGAGATMSRGFHAFFRQYYNLRALLRRVDPDLAGLRAVPDYPLLHADGTRDSFTNIPRRPPWNLLGFVAQSPSFPLRALVDVNLDQALGLLDVDFPATYSAYDGASAQDVLDGLRFPSAMRSLALEVFARSFFADPREFSGGELVAMFHAYFVGSAEGLLFDVAADDFDTTFWAPLGRYLSSLGAAVRVGTSVDRLESAVSGASGTAGTPGVPGEAQDLGKPGTAGMTAVLVDGARVDADAVVLATHRPGLQRLVSASPWLGDDSWRTAVTRGRMAPRFVVRRIWFDGLVRRATPMFLGTADFGYLDNVSAVHLMEAGAAEYARRTGGSVMELHAYAVPADVPDEEVAADLLAQLRRLHPELAGARIVHDELLVRADCPLVGIDPWATRPGVRTPDPRVVLAGDGVRCELPVALMERAATTGLQAANALLTGFGRPGHDLWTVPTTGRFAAVAGRGRRLARRLTPDRTGGHR